MPHADSASQSEHITQNGASSSDNGALSRSDSHHSNAASSANGAKGTNGTSSASAEMALANRVSSGELDNTPLALRDPLTRLLIEKLLQSSQQEVAPVEEKVAQRFNLTDYMAVVRRRWMPMLLVFVVSTALLAWRLQPGIKTYSATSTMMLPAQKSGFTESNDPLKTGIVADALGSTSATKIAMITSPPLVKEALNQLGPEMRERGWGNPKATSASVTAAAPVSPELINITVSANDPEAAKALANKLISVYVQRTRRLALNAYEDSLVLLGGQKSQAEKLLLKAKRDLQDYKEKHKILDISSRLTATATEVVTLESDAQIAQMEAAAGAASPTIQSDATVNDLRQRAADAKSRYTLLTRDLLPSAPEAAAARQQWREAENLLNKRISALQNSARQKANSVQARLAKARGSAAGLPGQEFELSRLESRVRLLEATHGTLSDRYTAVSLARFNTMETASVLTPAMRAVSIGRTWTHTIVIACLFGLVLAVLWAVVLEHIDNTVHSAEQLEGMLESPVLGTLPLISSVVEHGLPQWAGERHKALPSNADNTSEALSQTRTDEKRNSTLSNMLLESCRIIRTNLTFASVDMPLRTLLVTSTNSGEGKSFVAWNMAAAMAYDGKKVILVDCDLRRPTQHKLHSLPLIPGFTNVLIDPDTLESALHQTSVDNLRIMPAGAIPPNPPELLGSEHSRRLIANLQEHCDVLVIDSPPVLLLTDAQILSGMVDGVVFVVGADTTSSQHIQRAQANIRHAGGRLLGFVLNKTKSHNDPYGYYAHYGYYKYYNYNEEARESEKASPKAS